MAAKSDYRTRAYNAYHSTLWKFHHSERRGEYDLYAKVARKKWLHLLPRDRRARIVDVACGGGHFLYFLQKEGYTNTEGIDLSPQMAAFSRKMGVANVRQGDLFRFLPRHKNAFDLVIGTAVIEHMTKDEVLRFLDAAYGALRPGGRLLVSTLNSQNPFGAYVRYIDFTHETGFNAVSLAQVLRVPGFEHVRIIGEKPVAHDVRSAMRAVLWDVLDKTFRLYFMIERGTGRGFIKYHNIFEPHIYAVGDKPAAEKKNG